MYKSAKRVYTELNYINLENEKNPQSRKFIIDRTPFDKDDDSVAPTIVKDDRGQYYLIVGRILPTSEIYNRNAFTIQMKIPVEYPFRPPEIEMITPIYHPNIGPEGKISTHTSSTRCNLSFRKDLYFNVKIDRNLEDKQYSK